jgi:putative membrane protein
MNRKTSTFLSIGLSAALVAGAIWFLFNHHNTMWAAGPWQMPHGYGMMIGGAGMGFLMILFWVVVLVALVFLVSAAFAGRQRSSHTEDALDILQKRYARGEIDKQRYDAMRHDLALDHKEVGQ